MTSEEGRGIIMQVEQERLTYQDILSSYPTLQHFADHYTRQGVPIRLPCPSSQLPELELRSRRALREQEVGAS